MQEDSESETEKRITESPLEVADRDDDVYQEEWRVEVERRARKQRMNQMYIQRILSGTLHQMMIATLNAMPEEPTEFMKEYIRTHYTSEGESPSSAPTPRARAQMEERQQVGVKDLARLKEEIAELNAMKDKYTAYKAAFTDMHKNLQ